MAEILHGYPTDKGQYPAVGFNDVLDYRSYFWLDVEKKDKAWAILPIQVPPGLVFTVASLLII